MYTKKTILSLLVMLICVSNVWADYNPSWTGDNYTIRNVSSSNNATDGHIAGHLFDGDLTTKWVAGSFFSGQDEGHWYGEPSNPDVWVSFETSQPLKVTSYTLTTGDDTGEYTKRNPKTWRLEASSNNSNWVVLDSHTDDNTLPNADYASHQFNILSNQQAYYRYYRLIIQTTDANRHEHDDDGNTGLRIMEILIQLSEFSLAAETCNHRDDNHDGICDICGEEIPEDPANYFCEGDFWYEKCTINGVNGVKILSIANPVTTLTIPQIVYHRRNYPVLAISDDIGEFKDYPTGETEWRDGQEREIVIPLHGEQYAEYIRQIMFAPNSMVKEIEADAFVNIGSGTGTLGTITIPASVRSIGNGALNPAIRFEHVYFENGTQIEHLPARIKARQIHIPASVKSIDANMLTNDVIDIYMASSHLHNPDLNGDWTRMHILHVPDGLRLAYLKSKWHVDYQFTIQEDNTLTVPVKDRYALEVQAEAFGHGTVIEAYANDYATKIRNAATDAAALTLRDQALKEIEILLNYKDAVNEPYYSAPTEEGMRIRVTMNGGKEYEFNTRDVKSVNLINVQ